VLFESNPFLYKYTAYTQTRKVRLKTPQIPNITDWDKKKSNKKNGR